MFFKPTLGTGPADISVLPDSPAPSMRHPCALLKIVYSGLWGVGDAWPSTDAVVECLGVEPAVFCALVYKRPCSPTATCRVLLVAP
jgi:hypothetical protein